MAKNLQARFVGLCEPSNREIKGRSCSVFPGNMSIFCLSILYVDWRIWGMGEKIIGVFWIPHIIRTGCGEGGFRLVLNIAMNHENNRKQNIRAKN